MSCECKRQGDLCDPCTDLLATGEQQERERIIALLETLNIHCIDCMSEQFDELGLPKAEYTSDRLIAFIRGTA